MLVLIAQPQAKKAVIMGDHVQQGGKPAVMVKTPFLMGPQAVQRGCPVPLIGRAMGLKIIDADLVGRVQIPTRLGPDGLDVAGGAPRLAAEEGLATGRRLRIEAPRRRRGRREGQLIQVQRRQFRGDQIGLVAHMPEAVAGGDGELDRIIQARIKNVPWPRISRLATKAFQ